MVGVWAMSDRKHGWFSDYRPSSVQKLRKSRAEIDNRDYGELRIAMDDADYAAIEEQIRIDVAMRNRVCHVPQQTTGECLNCGERLPDGRWCDPECRADWERRNARY